MVNSVENSQIQWIDSPAFVILISHSFFLSITICKLFIAIHSTGVPHWPTYGGKLIGIGQNQWPPFNKDWSGKSSGSVQIKKSELVKRINYAGGR